MTEMQMMTNSDMANTMMPIVTNEALKMPFGTMGVMGDGAVIHGESSGRRGRGDEQRKARGEAIRSQRGAHLYRCNGCGNRP